MAHRRRADWQHGGAIVLAAIWFALAGANLAAAEQPEPTYYTVIVRPHDTVSIIAMRYDVSATAVARLNRLSDDSRLYPGEVLSVPAISRETRAAVLDEAANALIRSYAAPPKPIHVWKVESAHVRVRPLPPPQRYEAWAGAHKYRSHFASQERLVAGVDRAHFVWPVRGRVISPFGQSDNGERNDGINIAARAGTPIRAAASGVVKYAGDELKGYGNLVLIQHDDGYVTAYAHAQSLMVSLGDRVEKGQVIGLAGATGDVDRPQLHFEIRRGVTPVNPKLLLASDD
jgi:murein DD-endopeptidase MepM/ murein hydrolase activator NlpD